MALSVIGADEAARWDAVIGRMAHDAYHLHAFHALAEQRGEGRAQLYVYEEGCDVIAMPLLLRTIDVDGTDGGVLADATSVHGYAGPVSSRPDLPAGMQERFVESLELELRRQGVVAAFARLNPFLSQQHLLDGIGEIVQHGSTVAVDLTATDDERRRGYRRDTRRSLRKLADAGARAHVDERFDHIDGFIDLYEDTMDRVGATPSQRLSPADVRQLVHSLRGRMFHVVCFVGSALVAAGLYTACRGIVHAHLGAARNGTLALAPARLEIDMAMTWARATGNRVLHLGGGLGARSDSLYAFKRGFGRTVLPYCGWQVVLDPDRYRDLAARTGTQHVQGFFPVYRAPSARFAVDAGRAT
jgi:hypothetical protein